MKITREFRLMLEKIKENRNIATMFSINTKVLSDNVSDFVQQYYEKLI